MARQLNAPGRPSTCTAAANFLPAVVEARLSRIPLLVLTADRPPELRDWGAAQTIDQIQLFGTHVKWFVDMPVPVADDALVRHARATAARAVQTTASHPAGPVHLNLPFREPLLPADLRHPSRRADVRHATMIFRASGTWPTGSHAAALDELASQIAREPRGIIVSRPGKRRVSLPRRPRSARPVAIRSWPTLSAVSGSAHTTARASSTPMTFLRTRKPRRPSNPDVVIRVGAVADLEAAAAIPAGPSGAVQVVIDAAPRDPSYLATSYIIADTATTLQTRGQCCQPWRIGDRGWLDMWRVVDRDHRAAIASALAREEDPFEGRAVAEVAAPLPEGATLVVGNSMPIRDVDAFVRGDGRKLRIVSNRGANGIDGVVSTALGAAAVADGPVVLIVGDLSFFHDLNGLFAATKFDLDATVVVLNNDGGGIFHFFLRLSSSTPQHSKRFSGRPPVSMLPRRPGSSEHRTPDPGIGTPFDARWRRIRGHGLAVVELVTDRNRNVAQHRAVWTAAAEALPQVASVGG